MRGPLLAAHAHAEYASDEIAGPVTAHGYVGPESWTGSQPLGIAVRCGSLPIRYSWKKTHDPISECLVTRGIQNPRHRNRERNQDQQPIPHSVSQSGERP